MTQSQHHVCPHCDSVNRIPDDRLAVDASCGQCHNPLFDGTAIALDTDRFEQHVERNDIPVIVDFWAEWCGPCKTMTPVFKQAANQLNGKIRFIKVDTDANQHLAGRYQIRGIPTLIIFRQGKELARQSGAMDLGSLTNWILNTI